VIGGGGMLARAQSSPVGHGSPAPRALARCPVDVSTHARTVHHTIRQPLSPQAALASPSHCARRRRPTTAPEAPRENYSELH
jgi:hypothetical protein